MRSVTSKLHSLLTVSFSLLHWCLLPGSSKHSDGQNPTQMKSFIRSEVDPTSLSWKIISAERSSLYLAMLCYRCIYSPEFKRYCTAKHQLKHIPPIEEKNAVKFKGKRTSLKSAVELLKEDWSKV
jgi:hypothetical protein